MSLQHFLDTIDASARYHAAADPAVKPEPVLPLGRSLSRQRGGASTAEERGEAGAGG